MDPNKLTINQLKSILSEKGVELPTSQQQKSVYVELYKKHILQSEKEDVMEVDENQFQKGRRRSMKRRRESMLDAPKPKKNKPENTTQTTPSSTQPQQTSSIETPPEQKKPVEQQQQVFKTPKTSETKIRERSRIRHSIGGALNLKEMEQNKTRRRQSAQFRRRRPTSEVFISPNITNKENREPLYVSTPDSEKQVLDDDAPTPPYSNFRTPQPTTPRSPVVYSPGRRSQENRLQYLIRNLLSTLITVAIVVGLVWYFVLAKQKSVHVPTGKPYCDSDFPLRPDCQECPPHGYCANGKLIACEPPYVLNSISDVSICVEDEEISKGALHIAQWAKEYLAHKSGRFECYKEGEKEESVEKFKETAAQQQDLEYPKDKFDLCYDKFIENVKASDQFQLDIRKIGGEEYIFSTEPSIPFTCHLRIQYTKHFYSVNAAICGLVIILIVWYRNELKRRRQQDIEDIYVIVTQKLRENRRAQPEHLRDEIKESYSHQFDVPKLWPEVVKMVDGDSRISKSLGDNNLPIWEWTASSNDSQLGNISRELFSSPSPKERSSL